MKISSSSNKHIKNYKIIDRIGVGSFGLVYKVSKYLSKTFYVLKQIPFEIKNNNDDKNLKEAKNEALILSKLKNKYVVKYYDNFIEDKNLNIVMEYCEGGDLETYLNSIKKQNKFLSERNIWKFFIQISLGLFYIHNKKIIHRDMKCSNIFLTKNLNIKIGDLGVAKILKGTLNAHTLIGTPFYLSPEICEEKPYNEKSDVWALGCILYKLITFNHPYSATNQAALFLKILKENYEPINNVHNYSNDLIWFVNVLLEKDMNKRPNMKDVVENNVFVSKAKLFGFYDYANNSLNFGNSIDKTFIENDNNNNNNNKI